MGGIVLLLLRRGAKYLTYSHDIDHGGCHHQNLGRAPTCKDLPHTVILQLVKSPTFTEKRKPLFAHQNLN